MEQSLISLLTPNSKQEKHNPLANMVVPTAEGTPLPREQFARILEAAETRLRVNGKERVAEAEEQKRQEALDELLQLKNLADRDGGELIAGILPVANPPLQETPTLEAITAAVAFDPELPDTSLEFDAIEAATTIEDGTIHVAGAVEDANAELPRIFPEDIIEKQDYASRLASQNIDGDTPVIEHDENAEITALDASYSADILAAPIIVPQASIQQEIASRTSEATINAPIATAAASAPPRSLQPLAAEQLRNYMERITQKTANGEATQNNPTNDIIAPRVAQLTFPDNQTILQSQHSGQPQHSGDLTLDLLDAPDVQQGERNFQTLINKETGDQPLRLVRPTLAMLTMSPQEQISVRISQAAAQGTDKILIQLHPEELGRVDIRMNIDSENNAIVRVVAETRDAYDVLRSDKSSLERLLHESGLKTTNDSLEFGYQGQAKQGDDEQNTASGNGQKGASDESLQDEAELIDDVPLDNLQLIATTGLNIKV